MGITTKKNVRYGKTYGSRKTRHDDIREEFKKFLQQPRTKKEIMEHFNFDEISFEGLLTQVSVYWPIWEDFKLPHTYGWVK